MSVINTQPLVGASGQSTGPYTLSKSLRFRSSASAYLSRTPGSATNQKTWTFSAWVKRGAFGSSQGMFDVSNTGSQTTTSVYFISSDTIRLQLYTGPTTYNTYWESAGVFRDPAAWYHVVAVLDTTQASQTNMAKLYINGVQQTFTYTNFYSAIPQNSNWYVNSVATHKIGSYYGGNYFDGYMANVQFVDGQALTSTSFGSFSGTGGVWQPIAYTGSYGTNGFYLPFTDATSTSTLGNDSSGNSNTWTVNNISVTAGVTYDSMTDVPTLTSATAANYPTLNPLSTTNGTYQDGNLYYYGAGAWKTSSATIALPTSGKFYYEAIVSGSPYSPRGTTTGYGGFGVMTLASSYNNSTSPNLTTAGLFLADSGYYNNFAGSATDSGVSLANANVVALALDLTANTFTFYKNNTSIVTGTIGVTAGTPLIFAIASYDSSQATFKPNFGQRPFAYTPPSGFVALNTYNL